MAASDQLPQLPLMLARISRPIADGPLAELQSLVRELESAAGDSHAYAEVLEDLKKKLPEEAREDFSSRELLAEAASHLASRLAHGGAT